MLAASSTVCLGAVAAETLARTPQAEAPEPDPGVSDARGSEDHNELAYLRASFDHAPAGVAVIDNDGVVLHANQVFLDLFGRPASRLGQVGGRELSHPDDRELVDEIHERMASGESDHCSFESRFVRDDGTLIWTHVDVSLVHGGRDTGRFFVAHVRDVTQRKLAEEEFLLGAHRFREAFRNAPVGMLLSSLEGPTVWANRALKALLGYQEGEYRDVLLTDIVYDEDRSLIGDALPGLLAGAQDGLQQDLRLLHKNGDVLHVQLSVSVIRNPAGEPQYLVSQVVDVTDRKRAELKLRQRAEFDRVVTELSTTFINIPLHEIDSGIERSLGEIASAVGANRAAVVLFRNDDDAEIGLSHEWSSSPLGSLGKLTGLQVWDFMAERLAAGQTVYEADLVEEPPVRDATRDYLLEQGVRAFVAVPFGGERRAGLVGFAASEPMQWDAEGLALIRIGAEMISNVIERRVAEAALRESSDRLRQMADNVQTLFWVCSADTYELEYASKGLGHIFGLEGDDAVKHGELIRSHRLIHEDDFEDAAHGFFKGARERSSYEYRVRRVDGEVRWVRTRCFPVPDADGRIAHLAGITDDITEEKKAAEESEYHSRFEQLISGLATEFVAVPLERIDEGIDRALRLVGEFANVDISYYLALGRDQRTVQSICGWTSERGEPYRNEIADISLESFPWTLSQLQRGEVMCMPDMAALPPEAAPEREAAEIANLKSAVTFPLMDRGELVGVLGFSSLHEPKDWSEESLRIARMVATMFSSVLARRRAGHELARRVEFERLIAHLAVDLVNLPDARLDEGIVAALRELAAFTGFHAVTIFQLDAEGRSFSATHNWDSSSNRTRFDALQRIALADVKWSATRLFEHDAPQVIRVHELPEDAAFERALLTKLGTALSVHVPMSGSAGPLGFLAFASSALKPDYDEGMLSLLRIAAELLTNALERRRAERAVRQHQEELAHTLRLGTMGELAPWLAHELNQPLSAIASFARGCRRRLESGDVNVAELTEATDQMTRQAMRAAEVVQSLRRYVRKHEPRREWHTANDLVSSALALLRGEAKELEIEISCYLDSEPAWVQVDSIQLEQVILNLVRNGFEAIGASDAGRRRIALATKCNAGMVEVSVADTGGGFESADSQAFFEPFSSTKSSGLGLGLSLARSIVEAHGGRIRAESVNGEGATFSFTIPRSTAPRDASEGGF